MDLFRGVIILAAAGMVACGTTDQTSVGSVGGPDSGFVIDTLDSTVSATDGDTAGGGQSGEDIAQLLDEPLPESMVACLSLDTDVVDYRPGLFWMCRGRRMS